MRPLTAAALQLAPHPGPLTANSVGENLNRAVELIERCVGATGADLLVLPEAVTTGFTPGIPVEELWDLMSPIPGPTTEPVQQAAQRLGVHVVHCTYERGEERGVVYNSAVLIGPTGDVLGRLPQDAPVPRRDAVGHARRFGHRRGHRTRAHRAHRLLRRRLPRTVPHPGGARRRDHLPALGAVALRRHLGADNSRARAYDNHVYVIGANATGTDPAGVHYFGNSLIVTPIAEVVARAASHEGWAAARLDPADAMRTLTPGSDRAQTFDHLAERNLGLLDTLPEGPDRPGAHPVPARGRCVIRIGIDTGGTFTDVVAIDEDSGRAVAGKVPSTPADPSRGFIAAVRRALTLLDAVPADIAVVSHGTTVATNQLLQGKVDSLASSPQQGSNTCWRSLASPSPTATATATSGSSRRASSRPTWSAVSAGGWTPTARRFAPSTPPMPRRRRAS